MTDWWTLGILGVILIAGALVRRSATTWLHTRDRRHAFDQFRIRREQLEAKFFDLAAASGKPRGLRWIRCEWHPPVSFARDVETKLLTAFVAVDIYFAAVEGGDMEDVAAVSDVRNGCAVFHYQNGNWGTGGKVLFNTNPQDVVEMLKGQYEAVTREPRQPTG